MSDHRQEHVIGKERRRWLRLKERADAQLTALDHAETAFTSALGREPVPERAMQDTPQQEYVWAMGPACDATSNTWFVDKVEADARTATFPGELGKVDPTAPG